MSNMRVAVGKKPGWEVGKGEKDLEKVDVEKVDGEEKELKTISEFGATSVVATIQRWVFSPPFAKFSSRSRSKGSIDIPQPPHTLTFLGRCDIEIGPHVFLDTKIIEVNYGQTHTGPVQSQNVVLKPTIGTDVLMEFRENSTERFVVPLDCSIIERILRLGVPPTILLSTVVPAVQAGVPLTESAQQHPLTIHFVHAGTPLWEAMQKRVISSKMPIQTVQKVLQQAVDAPIPRVFIPHRLPAGPVLDSIAEAMADKFDAKPMVLKGLRETPQVAEPVKRKKLAQQMSTSTSSKSPLTNIGDSSASKKRYEKRVKVACSTCGKSIARKAEDAGQETFKPQCRNCAADARKVRDLARAAAAVARQPPKMKVDVVLPSSRRSLPYVPRPPGTLQWPNGGPGSFNFFSPRPPPAPPHLAAGYSPYVTTPIPGASGTTPSYFPGSTATPSSVTNPYAFPYRPPPLGTALPNPPGPPAHPYTGRYYGAATPDGQTWRPPLYTAPQYTSTPTRGNLPPPPLPRAAPAAVGVTRGNPGTTPAEKPASASGSSNVPTPPTTSINPTEPTSSQAE